MAKKLYTQNEMNSVLSTHSNIDRLRSVLKELRIKPVKETRTAKRTYRLYSQEQMDALVAWKKNHDAPVQPAVEQMREPEEAFAPPPAAPDPSLVILTADQIKQYQYLSSRIASLGAGLAIVDQRLTNLAAMTGQISSAVNLILEELTKPRADLGTLEGLVQGGKDDARAPN